MLASSAVRLSSLLIVICFSDKMSSTNSYFDVASSTTRSAEKSTTDPHNHSTDIGEHVTVITLVVISVYLMIVTLFYYCKHSLSQLRLIDWLICVTPVLVLVQCCWFEVEISMTQHTTTFCTVYTVINVGLATAIRTLIYSVLWIRQRSIYKGPLQNTNTTATRISWITLGGILFFSLCQIIIFGFVSQKPVPGGCESEELSLALEVILPLVFTCTSMFQFILLGLTLYPVVKQLRERNINSRKGQLKTVAVRLCISTAVCFFVDILFIIILQLKPADASISYLPICYAFNTLVNTIATLCSFANYRQRLWPFGKDNSGTAPQSRQGASSTASRSK